MTFGIDLPAVNQVDAATTASIPLPGMFLAHAFDLRSDRLYDSHLEGDALNVALLVPASQRVLPGVLVGALSEHYGSPGRLAEYRRQFERTSRSPSDDPC